MILGFIVFWPLGLAILAYMIWSGRMAFGTHRHDERWRDRLDRMNAKMEHAQDKMERARERMNGCFGGWRREPAPSGNRAFDEYRTETIQRLEEEQREFMDFLHRLRFAKDKAEFDQFMAERRSGAAGPPDDAEAVTRPSG